MKNQSLTVRKAKVLSVKEEIRAMGIMVGFGALEFEVKRSTLGGNKHPGLALVNGKMTPVTFFGNFLAFLALLGEN